MNDGIRHQLMAQDLLKKKILPPVVKNTLVKNLLQTEHALNLTDTMIQVGVYDKPVDIVQVHSSSKIMFYVTFRS